MHGDTMCAVTRAWQGEVCSRKAACKVAIRSMRGGACLPDLELMSASAQTLMFTYAMLLKGVKRRWEKKKGQQRMTYDPSPSQLGN